MLVLVIDDDDIVRQLCAYIIAHLGHESILSNGGVEGEALALEKRPDAVLLDVKMPNRDGFEVLIRLRADGYAGKIIVMSALPLQTAEQLALALGADRFMGKPFTDVELDKVLK